MGNFFSDDSPKRTPTPITYPSAYSHGYTYGNNSLSHQNSFSNYSRNQSSNQDSIYQTSRSIFDLTYSNSTTQNHNRSSNYSRNQSSNLNNIIYQTPRTISNSTYLNSTTQNQNTQNKKTSNRRPPNSSNRGGRRTYNQNRNKKQLSEPMMRVLKLVFQTDFEDNQSTAYHYLKQLESNIKLLSKDEPNYTRICTYVQNTHGPTHKFKLTVENIFVACRWGALKDFKEKKRFGNRKLLWHGTRLSNFSSILSNGLSIRPPSDVHITGKMFGDGIYFADVVTKAAQYCHADKYNPYGILILAQVALGKEDIRTKSEKIKQLPLGKNSVKGIGKYQHKKDENIRTEYNVEIPLGTLEFQRGIETSLDYNEYIVYDNNQIFVEYLVLVKFDFNNY